MGSRGPMPKPVAQRRGRAAVAGGGDVVVDETVGESVPLPDGVWHANAVAWWEEATASPAAAKWVPADLPLVHRALVMVHQWWTLVADGEVSEALKVHNELSKLEKRLYLGPEDRARGHIEVQPKGQQVRPGGSWVATPVSPVGKWQDRLAG